MGCFSTCFPKSKSCKSLKPTATTTPCLVQLLQRDDETLESLQFTEIIEPKENVNPIDDLPLKEDEKREKLNISGRKKVTFDLNVKIYEPLPDQDEIQGDLLVNSSNAEEAGDKIEKEEAKDRQCHSDSSSSSSLFSFPLNGYRYQDCKDSDDEFDQLVSDDESDYDYEDEDEDEEEDEDNEDEKVDQEESSESLFSLSIDSRKHKLSPVTADEVNSPAPARMKNLDSVLQPVENKAQWEAIKARAKVASQKTAKENKILGQEFVIPISDEPIVKPNQGIAVDTSLSTWLVGSEAAVPNTSNASSVSVGNSPSQNLTLFL